MNNPTDSDKERGYRQCECGKGIELLQSGFEVKTHSCSLCKLWVADHDEFFKLNDGARALSK